MNARKSARFVPQTLSRQLQSPFLKQAPPAYQALIANPPPPTQTRILPTRPVDDLPPTITSNLSPYQLARAKLDGGASLTAQEAAHLLPTALSNKGPRLTRRRPPVAGVSNQKSRPLPVVFGEDEIRRQFFRDHPFEAYRPKELVEGETIAEVQEPNGVAWTELAQRSTIPTAEDAISFTLNLITSHSLPAALAYRTALSQYTTLRAEHQTATLAARLQAEAHGAAFFGEVQRSLLVEERVLDEWQDAREIQARIVAASGRGGAAVAGPQGGAGGDKGMWAEKEEDVSGVVGGEVEFTGGVAYVERFGKVGLPVEETEATLEAR